MGFILVFKPIHELKGGKVKGNCDAELVLQAMADYENYHQAIIVTREFWGQILQILGTQYLIIYT
ncbi:MAG: hypothetical protein SCARUB_00033 [Candidatus Scalindua rubra]|uniref:Uncharacterized protein n=1 Tax=Candidatus Scalindua rubra TaxID=1872076 RepID=A0A1E3XGK5_9BACT|nr:MAG: hypothetical protein SCARUB_00033 [Candidatus Scalindua rubra]